MKPEYFTLVDKLSTTSQEGFIKSTRKVLLNNSSWGRFLRGIIFFRKTFYSWHKCGVAHLGLSLSLVVTLELWNGKQNSVPCMWEDIFTYVSIECGIVDSNVNAFLD